MIRKRPREEGNDGDEWDPRLAVACPLLSTEDFGFDCASAAKIATLAAAEFLAAHPLESGLRVVLVASQGSPALAALVEQQAAATASDDRVLVHAGDLWRLGREGRPCAYLVNPCNLRLVSGGSLTNTRVNEAAGGCLAELSREQYGTAKDVGVPLPVELPADSPIRRQEGVRTVLQVRGPNLNPNRPHCLADTSQAPGLLRDAYRQTFNSFWSLASSSSSSSPAAPCSSSPSASPSAKASGSASGSTGGQDLGGVYNFPVYQGLAAGERPLQPSGGGGGRGWMNALRAHLRRPLPLSLRRMQYLETDECVGIYDGYPKAQRHILLLPKSEVIDAAGPAFLLPEHLPALRRLHALARRLALHLAHQLGPWPPHGPAAAPAKAVGSLGGTRAIAGGDGGGSNGGNCGGGGGGPRVRLGYHAIPSMEPLHLHVISQDLASAALKKKQHWNSFSTAFFLSPDWVERELEEKGEIMLDKARYGALKDQAPKCFRCGAGPLAISKLKEHNLCCKAPIPESLAA